MKLQQEGFMNQDSPIISTKPLWSGAQDIDASGVRFMCPVCFQWVLREAFEEHAATHDNASDPE